MPERIFDVMLASVDRGLTQSGPLHFGRSQGHEPRQGVHDRLTKPHIAIFQQGHESWIPSESRDGGSKRER